MMSQLRQSEYQQKSGEGLILVIRCTIYKHALDTSQTSYLNNIRQTTAPRN